MATETQREQHFLPDSDSWYSQYERSHGPQGSLGESLRYFMRLFEDAPASYVITTNRLLIVNANATAQQMFGVTFPRLKGKPLALMVAESDREAFRKIIAPTVLESHGTVTRPLMLRVDSGRRDAEMPFSARVLRDEEGTPECVCWVFHDRHVTIDEEIL